MPAGGPEVSDDRKAEPEVLPQEVVLAHGAVICVCPS